MRRARREPPRILTSAYPKTTRQSRLKTSRWCKTWHAPSSTTWSTSSSTASLRMRSCSHGLRVNSTKDKQVKAASRSKIASFSRISRSKNGSIRPIWRKNQLWPLRRRFLSRTAWTRPHGSRAPKIRVTIAIRGRRRKTQTAAACQGTLGSRLRCHA